MAAQVRFLSISFLVVLLFSCSTKKTVPSTSLPVYVPPKDVFSDLVINYRLDKSGIQDTFNTAIDEALKANFDIPDYDVKMVLTKPKEAAVEIEGKNILVIVPIAIGVEKKTFLTTLKAKGMLEMSFITSVDIDSLWNLKTKTTLSHHRWVEKPKLNVVGLNLPIEMIASTIIEKSTSVIEQGIDDSVKQSFTLKQKMKETMAMFDKPMQMDPTVNAFLKITPKSMELNQVRNNRFSAIGKIGIRAMSSFTTKYPTNTSAATPLPKVYWNEAMPDSSLIRLVLDIDMYEVNQLLKLNLDGQKFANGDKHISVNNIITNCDYEYIRVSMDVSGSVNGQLLINGRPKYNEVTNTFSVENIDIQLKTKNAIHKAAAWIAEGKIRNEMQKLLQFPISDNIEQLQNNINAQVANMNKLYDMEMKVGIGSIVVEKFELKPGQIQAVMKSNCFLEVRLKDFKTFNKF
jgi:hypothetical protein